MHYFLQISLYHVKLLFNPFNNVMYGDFDNDQDFNTY